MCGFAGFCDTKERFTGKGQDIAGKMAAKIRHRGPDSGGFYSDSFFSVGFCRLKIVDPENGEQPMFSPDGRYVLVFNGEIYNRKTLKKELESDFGVRFRTSSDTEVLLFACICHGKAVFRHLRGMYSFVFYDRKNRYVLAARDPFGIKPFYYGFSDGCLLFASEIKAMSAHPLFKKEFNPSVLPYYLQFQYVPTEETAFSGVFRLLPGHFFTYDGKDFTEAEYFHHSKPHRRYYESYYFYDSKTEKLPKKTDAKEAAEMILSALTDSVALHKEADTEVGALISGGVDSGLIAALARPGKAYTIGFDDPDFDEREKARESARFAGCALTEEKITPDDFFRTVPIVQYHSDEPYANLSAVPLYLISRRASSDVKVLLSGEGADELFGGYEWYLDSFAGKAYRTVPSSFRKRLSGVFSGNGKFSAFINRNENDTEESYIGQARIMSPVRAYSLLSEKYRALCPATDVTSPFYRQLKNASDLEKKLWLDRHLWLPFDILSKADKMTMANSVELRVPYLDLGVYGAAQTLSDSLTVRGKKTKYAFRKAAGKVLPKSAAEAPKKGFPVPFRKWIRSERYRDTVLSAFESETAKKFFNTEALKVLLDRHFKGLENNARAIYTVYAFICWYDIFFGAPEPSSATLEAENEYEKD